MKNYILLSAMTMVATASMAQETYSSADIAKEDLNGTARYVGMGGAMEALGADISTINSNPAGIGFFRKSWIGTTISRTNHSSDNETLCDSKSVLGFDQLGFVYSTKGSNGSFINLGFNYHKSRNFNQILAASNTLKGGSSNKLTYIKAIKGGEQNGGFDVDYDNYNDSYIGYESSGSDYVARTCSQVDYLNLNAINVEEYYDVNGKFLDFDYFYNDASGFDFFRNQKGYIGEYDFNISGNVRDRYFWGITLGVHDVHYSNSSEYTESLIDKDNKAIGNVRYLDEREITGQGYDVKFGFIFRPFENDPFRIGLSIATPTWYTLDSENYTKLINNSEVGMYDNGHSSESYKYKVFTPWKFGLSAGTTFGKSLAIGASMEYCDYSSISNRYIYDTYYDSDDFEHNKSKKDYAMNRHTEKSLNGVATLKVGAEYKVTPNVALRLGYNYVDAMYKSDAYRDGGISSDGTYFTSATDYTNWDATNRFTCGLGYSNSNFNVDLAYQYTSQNGKFYPFQQESHGNLTNYTTATDVTDTRHQLMLSIGYRF